MKEKLLDLISESGLSRISNALITYSKPSLRLVSVDKEGKEIQVGISKLGGCPDLPPGIKWPVWGDLPLSFIGQLDLSEVSKLDVEGILPQTGMLFFFYDADQRTWGFDPNDKGSWQVFYANVEKSALIRIPFPRELTSESHFQEWPVEFSQEFTLPPWESTIMDEFQLSDEEEDLYIELLEEVSELTDRSGTVHRLLGYPDQIQCDMQLECQLVSNGLYCGDSSGYGDIRSDELQKGAKEWRLLLQIDSEESIGMCWGDVGKLYFWIKESDLREKDFSNVWMALQCY